LTEVDGPVERLGYPQEPEDASSSVQTARHMRGSSVVFAGRLLAVVFGLVSEVLLVRYLSKGQYGSFAYALSVLSLGTSISVLGLDKAAARFIPIYQEQHDRARALGTIVLAALSMVVVGTAVAVIVAVLQADDATALTRDAQAAGLLLILIALAPIRALGALQVSLLAVFSRPGAIFVRRYLLDPGSQLLAVAILVVTGRDVQFVALGYLIAGVAMLVVYSLILVRLLSRIGILADGIRLRLPVRSLFSYSLPLLSTDLVFVLRGAIIVIALEALHSTVEVASYRASLPIARQNMIVVEALTILFIPVASRLFARQHHAALNDLYWQTAIWITILTFPLFAASFAFSDLVATTLYGIEYASSGSVLAILAVGFYVNAALGFNGLVLRVYARVRYLVIADLITAAVGLSAGFVLIREFGALGAALATAGILLLQNLLYHVGVARFTPVRWFEPRYLPVYLLVTAMIAGLLVVQVVLRPPFLVAIAFSGTVWVFMILRLRTLMRLSEVFPEVRRVPILGRLL